MFNHIDLDLKPIARETIDGVRYYKIPDEEEPLRLVSCQVIMKISLTYTKYHIRIW